MANTSPGPKSRYFGRPFRYLADTLPITWRPTASGDALRLRARVLAEIRSFFAERQVLEVETPLLGHAPVTALHLDSFPCRSLDGRRWYLQTSPEYAMKRLLAAGSGPIYQIAKAFRDGEAGRRHNPEFTLLEWYRPGWDHHALMEETAALLARVLGNAESGEPLDKVTYRDAFRRHLDLDPFTAPTATLRRAAEATSGAVAGLDPEDRDAWLDLLLSLAVQPHLGRGRPIFLYDYPARQAALARVRGKGPEAVAERFEVFVEGVELANGYHELTDAAEQRRRFAEDLEERRRRGRPALPMDERLLAALEAGLPPCAGIALGVDRLLLLLAGAEALEDVLAFPIDRA
jgi:elongation factor P--(R)-beta-lysine ligase